MPARIGSRTVDRDILRLALPALGALVAEPLFLLADTANIIWFLLAGIWLAVAHLVSGVALCITIIGIPLGIADFKMIPISIAPLGKEIVES